MDLTWYDKLVLSGLLVAAIGAAMFLTGLWFAMDAKNQAQANLRASIRQATEELRIR